MNDNKYLCNNDYQKARKIVEEASKNIRYCYLRGPKGDKGDVGSSEEIIIDDVKTINYDEEANIVDNFINNRHHLTFYIPRGEKGNSGGATIRIGTTKTVDYDEEALVTNVGTDENVILDFTLPRGKDGSKGDKGDKGDIGPRGLPGEIGRSEAITIDEVETVSSDEDANIIDDFDNNVHHLSFYIPKGDKGDKGEAGGISAYGERYSNTSQRFNVTADAETIIPLEQAGPAIFTNYNSTYAIEIRRFGTYLISFALNVATSVDTKYTVGIRTTGLRTTSSDIKVESKAGILNYISHSFLFGLVEDDEVTLVITTEDNTELIFNDNFNASLTVVKLD